ncbi:hypothetical protein IFM89_025990 [Coptis chinensis]|uniref:Disease resistance N-terminal domain-containing protein n=1 Tax=Coptis chinensis TaxID=261450 RepID=A0A835LZP6_9MAGN|nr:hypothetical protein IFM89_025990 [Coptis chinensis]
MNQTNQIEEESLKEEDESVTLKFSERFLNVLGKLCMAYGVELILSVPSRNSSKILLIKLLSLTTLEPLGCLRLLEVIIDRNKLQYHRFSLEVVVQYPRFKSVVSLLPPVVLFHGTADYSIPLDFGKDARSVKIKKRKDVIKFKVRCSKYLYTLCVFDSEKADKLRQFLPPVSDKAVDLTRKAARAPFCLSLISFSSAISLQNLISSLLIRKIMAEAILSSVIGQLAPVIRNEVEQEVRLVVGVRKEVKKLDTKLRLVKAVLEDAEKKEIHDNAINIWLEDLKDVMYDADDVLDEWNTQILISRINGFTVGSHVANMMHSYLLSMCACFKHVGVRHDIAKRIKGTRERLDEIALNKGQLSLVQSHGHEEP